MVEGHSIIRAGHGRPSRQNQKYEYTTSSIEVTAHRIGSRGTSDALAKLTASEAIASCVFDFNLNEPPYNSTSEIFDTKQSKNTIDVQVFEPEQLFVFNGILDDGESVTKNKLGTYEPTTGKLQGKAATQIAAVIFQETLAASGADEYIEAVLLGALGAMSPVAKQEEVAITSDVATLTYAPIGITTLQLNGSSGNTLAATVVNGVSSTALVASNASWTPGLKAITTAGTDTLTTITITYSYVPGNE